MPVNWCNGIFHKSPPTMEYNIDVKHVAITWSRKLRSCRSRQAQGDDFNFFCHFKHYRTPLTEFNQNWCAVELFHSVE